MINKEKEIKEKVLFENAKLHDKYAKMHTKSVPYISRRITRNYIHNLIIQELNKRNINLKNINMLDLACGTGTFIKLYNKLASRYGGGYTGIDISKEMIKQAKLENKKHKNLSFKNISLEEFAKSNKNKYDIILSASFLHHLYNIKDGLDQIKSILKPGGIYIAIHEEVIPRHYTGLEVFDQELVYLYGYGGYSSINIFKRIYNFSKYIFKVIFYKQKLIKLCKSNKNKKLSLRLWKFAIWKREQKNNKNVYYFLYIPFFIKTINQNKIQEVDNKNDEMDYVDYQLNFGFNLTTDKIINSYGDVVPYCYYSFAELRHIKKVNNNNMFIMVK